jgi:glyoxalase family protein
VTPQSAAPIAGIRHLAAISSNAQRTIDFYTQLLGLPLTTLSVDPDDPRSYQLVFGDEERAPGFLTFSERSGAPRGKYGIGGVHHLAFATADRHTLLRWKRWLTDCGIPVSGPYDRVYFESIYFTDPDGLILEIATQGPGWTVDEAAEVLGAAVKLPPPHLTARYRDEAAIAAETWPQPIAAPTPEMRLRRLHHVTAIGSDAAQLERFFADTLGLRLVKRTVNFDDPSAPHLYFGAGDGPPGTIVTYFAYPRGAIRAVRPGAGLTHHFALSVSDEDSLMAWRERLAAGGTPVSDVLDRLDYRGFQIRDPDGIVLEIATEAPPPSPDAATDQRGLNLRLPPWLEARRSEIIPALRPLTVGSPIGR